ncbi:MULTISPECIES: hypothetical protein [Kordiimonas]|jgi:hypothetical protein|uniref:hypothetical protein n=1 Tax=Kordiimonas TaxID=288021 RepID=UPI00257E2A66|nr:hypothetical protein [Kordiimonas sp. UBA4487]
MLGQSPRQTCRQTLPELKLRLRGWQRAHGINPDTGAARDSRAAPMTRERLLALAERYDHP